MLLKKCRFFLLAVLMAILLCSCSAGQSQAIVPASAEQEPLPDPPAPAVITLAAVGDNILHNTVYQSAKTSDGYDFLPLYQPVAHLIAQADIAFVNQEAPMGGDGYAPSSYPNFNSPQEIGRDLVTLGFDVINLANNHMMDKGAQAALNTLDYLSTLSCQTIGASSSEEMRQQPVIVHRNDITVGFLGYTYSTNGIPLPKDKPYLVSLIDRDVITQEVTALRSQYDFLVVSMHWGNEYQLKPSQEQQELAQLLADLEVDIIIGTHPHVIQPAEWLTSADNGHQTFVVYSLGNFISSQSRTNTMLGGMLTASLQKTADGDCSIEDVGLLPLVTHFEAGAKSYRVYPLSQYTEVLAQKHRLRAKNGDLTAQYFNDLAYNIWGQLCLDESAADILLGQ